ncbi:MAG: serine hydroxymethyltransferase [Candidatus Magasanikbacteria bacterium RIFCSPHIGHO2_02_FULL_50_9b]|uniref:Serine hydroxymethyltransferase n=1 Tax=Candidatus Magasanikbacteria bacterium RIFCSPHIGHO2_02_FULL_50_9b TaxID=1798682 RepID=A0A1F6M7V1_9BACT|nr:MAG: serine hydroxymethyltransferase [Candidatus Magasanikbacteria bacterium RIFCSPHIGHO2_02_FULL_50_9b]
MLYPHLAAGDPEVRNLIMHELQRRRDGIDMIPSENVTSPAVLDALGSILTDKYSEGYPGRRYYGGNEYIDQIEELARARARSLFGVTHANVQPYSGSPANQAVYLALCNPGDTVLGLSLFHGGHLTHGLGVNFSGIYYKHLNYTTTPEGFIDYDGLQQLAEEHRPRMIVCGATAYSRKFDFARLASIAHSVDAFLLADISHIAGLIVGDEHPSPVGHADVITTTTHKTLRGPRGALILCNGNPSTPLKAVEKTRENIPTLIDRAVFPGLQGGPHNHQTAAIAVALKEAATPEFKTYAHQVVVNARTLCAALIEQGHTIVTGGTENHLMLMDVTKHGLSGGEAEVALGKAGITVNKNTIPHDPRKPFDPSGIRIGTPALTSRGMKEPEVRAIAEFMHTALMHHTDDTKLADIRRTVTELSHAFPPYPELNQPI